MPCHDGGKRLLFSFNPLIQLSVTFCAARKAECFQCLFERHAGFESALAAGRERNEINMKMRRGFIHVQMRREHAERWVALLEGLHILVEHLPGKLSILGCGVHIVFVSDLDDEFFKQLFLLARADFLVVIVNHAILAGLLLVVASQRAVKQFVIDGSDIFVAVFDVERRSAGIDVLSDEVPAVVGQRAFAAHGGDGSFHGASFLVRGWVAGVLLLLSRVTQKHF